MSWIRNTAGSKGWAKADLYGVLCLALGELCWLGGPEEGAQVQEGLQLTCTVYSVSLSVSSAGWVDLKRGARFRKD
jgi:hypothetical protein